MKLCERIIDGQKKLWIVSLMQSDKLIDPLNRCYDTIDCNGSLGLVCELDYDDYK